MEEQIVKNSEEYKTIIKSITSQGSESMYQWSLLENNYSIAFDFYGDWKSCQGFLLGLQKGIELSLKLGGECNG